MHQVKIYYTFCPLNSMAARAYLKYQRALADKLLSYGFRNHFGIEFEKDKIVKGTYGKPCWKEEDNFQFNISNTNGLVVCALSDIAIGVDTEKIKSMRISVIYYCCTEAEAAYITKEDSTLTKERRFFQIWTLKESYIKMIGEGMHFPLKEVAFTIKEKAKNNTEILCNQPAFFVQKQIKDYWISLCSSDTVEVSLEEVKVEQL